MEQQIKTIKEDVEKIKIKVFNGINLSIKNIEDKIDYIETNNKDQHKEINSKVIDLGKKIDKMIFSFFGITALSVVGLIIKNILEIK